MAQSTPPAKNSTWTIVLIIVGILILAGLMNLGGMPLWSQFAGVGILVIVAAVVYYFWRRSSGGEQ